MHKVINVDDVESFKDSILDVIQWTPAALGDELSKECERCGVNEDAGVCTRLFVRSEQTFQGVHAWIDLPVTFHAESVYKTRLDAAARVLSLRFKVKQTQAEGDRDEITIHRLAISYLYPA